MEFEGVIQSIVGLFIFCVLLSVILPVLQEMLGKIDTSIFGIALIIIAIGIVLNVAKGR